MTSYEVARPEALARLRAAAADRKMHTTYLEALVSWWENGADDEREPDDGIVSAAVAMDLYEDVAFVFNPATNVSGPLAYPERRRRAKIGAAQAARTRAAGGIERLLP